MLRVRERGAQLSERWHAHGDRAFRLSRSLISTLQNRRRLSRVAFGRREVLVNLREALVDSLEHAHGPIGSSRSPWPCQAASYGVPSRSS